MSAVGSIYVLIGKDAASTTLQRLAGAAAGRCRWLSRWESAVMPCRERAIPGGVLCAEHLIDNERTKP